MPEEFPRGLSQAEAAARLAAEGGNQWQQETTRGWPVLLGQLLREPMFVLLLAAGGLYLMMGDSREALILLGFVVIIMSITLLQERRTERVLEALRDLSSPRALVVRDGQPQRIPAPEVVCGDILLLAEGDRVPADGLLLQAHELACDESMLSGESVPVAKFADGACAYAGTLVVRGQGVLQVTATGKHTELGRIGQSLQAIEVSDSPLRQEMARLTRRLTVLAGLLCLCLAVLHWWLSSGWLAGLLSGITLAMGILPQEFAVILIVFMALGARRLAQHQVLTRQLNSIETLGQTTVLCVDKTGTLTHNRMRVAALQVADGYLDVQSWQDQALPEAYHELLEYAVLASETAPQDPMELAFQRFADDFLSGTEHLHADWALVREYELSAQQLAMSHLWQAQPHEPLFVACKGAPEAIVDLCHLDAEEQVKVLQQAAQMAEAGLRVLAVAKARHVQTLGWPERQHDFEFSLVGLIGLLDPLRDEVPAAIAECQQAGIRVLMITGDHPRTARAIAQAAGIQAGEVHSGADLAAMSVTQLADCVARSAVFARVSPAQKLAIVEALKGNGEVVAMTGDGVNDAPALKAAHIGIAMGKRGTDVAREAAALILLEDDFTAIVRAVALGRRIFANLRQALIYTLAVHVPIILLALLPLLFGWPLLLAPMHIAFLELVIDPACSIVFEAESGSRQLMKQRPRPLTEPLVSRAHVLMSLLQGAGVGLAVAVLYGFSLRHGVAVEVARGMAFSALVLSNALLIFACRSARLGWRAMFGGLSRTGLWVLSATLAGVLLVCGVPAVAPLFAFQPPSALQWLLVVLVALSLLGYFSLLKWLLAGAQLQPRVRAQSSR